MRGKDDDRNACRLRMPPTFDQVYGSLTSSSGQSLHFADLRSNEVFLSSSLAQLAGLHPGQGIQIQMEEVHGIACIELLAQLIALAAEHDPLGDGSLKRVPV